MKAKMINFFYVCVGIFLFGVLSVVGVVTYFSFDLPKISTLSDYKPPIPSQIMAKDGTILAEIGEQKREVVAISDVPEFIINAFLSAEDDSFYQHTGVDYQGVLRALIINLKAGRVVQGGSTITQQVAKSLLLNRERSISRKIKDVLLAQRIEKKFSKEEILFLYLNQVYLGGGYYGIKAAFKGYFGKELFEATLAEAAMVAGLLVAPGKYSPYINPAFAKKRQSYVLKRLLVNHKISKDEYQLALREKIKYQLRKKRGFRAGYFTDWIRQKIVAEVGEESFLRDGYKIYTTLDWHLQQKAEKEVLKGVKSIDRRQGYKGPLRHLMTEIEIAELEIGLRKQLYRNRSEYFTLDHENKRDYEISFNEDNFQEVKDKFGEKYKEITPSIFYPGTIPDDPFLNYLEEGKSYEAVVSKVSDSSRVIYVSIGGQTAIIPYNHYRWAHERKISGDKNLYPYVTRPSTIVAPGDVILVEIVKKKTKLFRHLHASYLEKYLDTQSKKRLERIELAKKEHYILAKLDQVPDAQGALVSISLASGEIVAMVGGTDFAKSQFNRALQSKRQPGSCFKPFLYAAGLEEGMTPASIIIDSPEALAGVDETLKWKPRNYDGKFKGPITFRHALEHSRNVPTIKLANKLGIRKILEFIKRIDLNAEVDQDLSIALGSFGISLIDIVKAYGIFPNKGKLIRTKAIISVMDRDGNPVEINFFKREVPQITEVEPEILEEENPYLENLAGDYVYDARLSYLMTNLLRGVILYGTGRGARRISPFIGGKTGTTNNYVDAWFLGFSANLVTGVWTGFDNNQTLGWGETGAKAALPIWREFMKEGLKKFGERDFVPPKGIVNVLVDKETGELAKDSAKVAFMESFVEGTQPGTIKAPKEEDKEPGEESKIILEDDEYYNAQN
ncbi:MAG: PBP1A family penicillin-binding protein [Deltaproteobacteria bacterium]|nr:MAG: PBP1A family penicillin-binding protein [Deltaproteobacteria bacterium]